MITTRHKYGSIVALGLLAFSATAHAEPNAAASKRAEALFQEAKALMNAGRVDEACPKLEQARALDGGGGTVLALALCHERQGRLAVALDEFRDALALARAADRADRAELATQHITDLEARVPQAPATAQFDAPATTAAPATPATPDATKPAGAPTQSDATKPHAKSDAPKLDGETRAADSAAAPASASAASSASKPPRASATETGSAPKTTPPTSARRSAAWLTGGLGVAAVAVGSYYGVRAIQLRKDAEAACGGLVCTGARGEHGVQLDQQSARAGAISTATFCVAGAAAAASTWLFFTSKSEPAVQVGAAPEAAGLSFVASGRF